MKLTAKFTQRSAMTVQIIPRAAPDLIAKQSNSQVKLTLVTHENQTMLLSAGARGERGFSGVDGKNGVQGPAGVVIVALQEVAQIDGGFF